MGCKDDNITLYFEFYHNIYTGILNFTFLKLRQFYHYLYSTIHFYMLFSIQAHQNPQKTFLWLITKSGTYKHYQKCEVPSVFHSYSTSLVFYSKSIFSI